MLAERIKLTDDELIARHVDGLMTSWAERASISGDEPPDRAEAEKQAALDFSRAKAWNRRLRRARHNPLAFRKEKEPEREGGTKQTRRKIKADVISRLLKQGYIERIHQSAAMEIHDVQVALMMCFLPTKGTELRVDSSPNRAHPLDRLGERHEYAFRHRYTPWVKSMMAEPVEFQDVSGRYAYRHGLAIVTEVVLDNVGTREIEDRHGVRHGHARKVVRGGLERYCIVAGWMKVV